MGYDEGDMLKEMGSRALSPQLFDGQSLPKNYDELFKEVEDVKKKLERLEKRLAVVERGAPPVNINAYYARTPV